MLASRLLAPFFFLCLAASSLWARDADLFARSIVISSGDSTRVTGVEYLCKRKSGGPRPEKPSLNDKTNDYSLILTHGVLATSWSFKFLVNKLCNEIIANHPAFQIVRFFALNWRGHGNGGHRYETNLTDDLSDSISRIRPNGFNAILNYDLPAILSHVKTTYPDTPLTAIGHSLGSIVLNTAAAGGRYSEALGRIVYQQKDAQQFAQGVDHLISLGTGYFDGALVPYWITATGAERVLKLVKSDRIQFLGNNRTPPLSSEWSPIKNDSMQFSSLKMLSRGVTAHVSTDLISDLLDIARDMERRKQEFYQAIEAHMDRKLRVMVVAGAYDLTLLPRSAREIYRRIPIPDSNKSFQTLPAGHIGMYTKERPSKTLAKLISDFIQKKGQMGQGSLSSCARITRGFFRK